MHVEYVEILFFFNKLQKKKKLFYYILICWDALVQRVNQ